VSINNDYKQGIMAALAIVKAHKPGGNRKHKLGYMPDDIAQSIRDEERGEQIAKEIIIKHIENLLESIY